MTVYRVRHDNIYAYGDAVVSSHNEARLFPRRLPHQELRELELRIDPTPDTVTWHHDYFGNDVVFFSLQEPHDRLVIRTESTVELQPLPALDTSASRPWEEVVAAIHAEPRGEALDALEYCYDSPLIRIGEALEAYARPSFAAGRPLAEAALDLSHRIHEDFEYDQEATTLETPLDEVLENRHGVCQDFTHVMLGAMRSLGLPARYVSGYLRSRRTATQRAETPAEESGNGAAGQDDLVGSEASHAWVAAWCPALGWFQVDPTNDLVPDDRHVVLAWGRDYDDVSPLKGVTVGGGKHTVEVAVSVKPV